jgi:hypothetical protein
MANVYQQGYSYVVDTGTPETGSFVINNSTWTSATTISLHNIPFDSYGSGSGGVQITGSSDVDFSEYYGSLGAGSVIFATYSGSSYSWNVTNVTENTGYFTFTVTNLTGPGGGVESGASPVNFYVQPAGANATIANNANNRITTATGTAGELNAETNLVFDGTNLGVGTASPLLLAHFKSGSDAQVLIESDGDDNIAGVLFKTEDTDTLIRVKGGIYFDNSGGDIYGRGDIKIALNNAASNTNVSPSDAIVTIEQGGTVTIDGTLNADIKNFDIPHPSKEEWRLRYSVLEGPEYGVYVRGKLRGSNCIELPDYWKDLVYEDSITVHLTPYQNSLPHWLERIELAEGKIYIGAECTSPSVDYIVHAERKHKTPLVTEYKAEE